MVVGIHQFRRTIDSNIERVTFENSVCCGSEHVGCFLVLRKLLLLVRFVFECGYCSVSFQSSVLSHFVIAVVRNSKQLYGKDRSLPAHSVKTEDIKSRLRVLLQVLKRSIDKVP